MWLNPFFVDMIPFITLCFTQHFFQIRWHSIWTSNSIINITVSVVFEGLVRHQVILFWQWVIINTLAKLYVKLNDSTAYIRMVTKYLTVDISQQD